FMQVCVLTRFVMTISQRFKSMKHWLKQDSGYLYLIGYLYLPKYLDNPLYLVFLSQPQVYSNILSTGLIVLPERYYNPETG
ncbi:hypothetical protein, partial [Alkanindiges hydrocarboniclasticus]|uniref:hypothetical protein n=1 Tax=Alkanindiges hydrocarboniclasticus TaxID=1907941 RepID=UPI001D0D25DA